MKKSESGAGLSHLCVAIAQISGPGAPGVAGSRLFFLKVNFTDVIDFDYKS